MRARAVGRFHRSSTGGRRTLPLDRVSAKGRGGSRAASANSWRGTCGYALIALNNETVLDRIMVIARNRALAVHHVTVHELRDKLAVSLDLDLDGRLSLRATHDKLMDWRAPLRLSSAQMLKSGHTSSAATTGRLGQEAPPSESEQWKWHCPILQRRDVIFITYTMSGARDGRG